MAARRRLPLSLVYLIAALAFWACTSDRGRARRYELRGQILAIRPEVHEVLIKHGDIDHFMPGMTMPFKVRDPALLAGKAAGDLVTAQLMVGDSDAWLASLERTGTAPLETVTAIPPAAFVTPLELGDHVPDTTLTDQDGSPVSLAGLRNRAAVVTFVYLRCPLPQFCPMMDRRFAEIQRAIQAEASLTGRTTLLSVSFDPDHDMPAVLKAHAAKLGADPSIWRLATAPRETIDRFAATFGVNVIREDDQTITHNLRTAVVGPDGRVVSVYDGGDWTSAQVLEDLRRAMSQR